MNCERVVELLTGLAEEGAADERREAALHAADCVNCRGAVASVHALRLASLAPVPSPRPDAWQRVLAAVTQRPVREEPRASRFWLGLGLGAAMATAATLAVISFMPFAPTPEPAATPILSLALNEPQPVNISLSSPEALIGAEIHVVLSGAISLGGYPGQKELQWRTDLDSGVNQLTLPVIATGEAGGQVLVEVVHDGKRRTFLVDVETSV